MDPELVKIDEIKKRFNVSYREARDALERSGQDLVAAILLLEQKDRNLRERIADQGEAVWDKLKDIWRYGEEARVQLRRQDCTIFEIPAPIAAAGILGALTCSELTALGAFGAGIAFLKNYTFGIRWPSDSTLG